MKNLGMLVYALVIGVVIGSTIVHATWQHNQRKYNKETHEPIVIGCRNQVSQYKPEFSYYFTDEIPKSVNGCYYDLVDVYSNRSIEIPCECFLKQ